MGSRVMHYYITSILNKSLGFTDDSFLLGGLAPDVHSYMGASHYLTHFSKKDERGNTYIDYEEYVGKYLVDTNSPFHLGYYFHLIFDDIWKREIYYKKIKCLPLEQRGEALQKNYRDLWRLNGKIIDHYSLELMELQPILITMDEIECQYLPELINALNRDFKLKDAASGEALELLDFETVLSVIEESIRACLDAYSKLTQR